MAVTYVTLYPPGGNSTTVQVVEGSPLHFIYAAMGFSAIPAAPGPPVRPDPFPQYVHDDEIGDLLADAAVPATDPVVAALLSNGGSQTATAVKAASVAAVEDADSVAPTGAWDFTQAPTVAGEPLGAEVDLSGYAELSAANVFAGDQRVNGTWAMNAAPDVRTPFNAVSVIDSAGGTIPGTTDFVGQALQTIIEGDFTGVASTNPGFLWGVNVFTATGNGAGDGHGLTNLHGALVEASVRAPGDVVMGNVIGLMAEAAFMGAAAAATVAAMTSLRVAAPKRKDGATGGSVTGNVYGIFVEGATAAAVGAAGTAYSVFVQSGTTYLGGPLTVVGTISADAGRIATAASRTVFDIHAGVNTTDGSRLHLRQNSVDGYARLYLPQASARFVINDGTNDVAEIRNSGEILGKRMVAAATTAAAAALIGKGTTSQTSDIFQVQDVNTVTLFAVTSAGIPRWTAAVNQQTTVGAAGAATALPATPTKYLKIVDSTGTTLVVPAYAAA